MKAASLAETFRSLPGDVGGDSADPHYSWTTSQYTKPSRVTTPPVRHEIGSRYMGASHTNVWNSPFSPHGSTPSGRSARNASSNTRPANEGSRARGSMHTTMALTP